MGVPQQLLELESVLGYRFTRQDLLEHALTHASQAREMVARADGNFRVSNNEQLEFLGDAVLGFVSAEELCRRFPELREGELSKLRAHLVSEKHLVKIARGVDLGKYLRLSKGEEKNGGRGKTALLVDALEAVIAAIYLDGGMDPARGFIVHKIMNTELDRIANGGDGLALSDYKSELQEKLQASGRSQPTYVLIKEDGPDHRKIFTVEGRLNGANDKSAIEHAERAEGSTKKSAEQESARLLLKHLAPIAEVQTSDRAISGTGTCPSESESGLS